LAALALGMVGGLLAERFGPIRALVVAYAVTAAAIAGLGVVPAHDLLVVAVVMVAWGAVRPIGANTMKALANTHAAPEHRGAVQNYLYWLGNGSILLGLVIGAEALGAGHSPLPLFTVAAVYVLSIVPTYAAFRADLAPWSQAEAGDGGFYARLALLARDRALMMAALAMLASVVVDAQLDSSVPLSLVQHFRQGTQLFGPIVAVDSVVVVAAGPLLSRWTSRFRPTGVYLVGSIVYAAGLAFAGIDGTVAGWFIGMVFFGAGEVLWMTPLNQVLGELPVPGREVLYFSVIGMSQYCASFIGPAVGPAVLAVDPAALWLSLLFVSVLGSWAFTDATAALRRRAAFSAAVEVRAAGCTPAEPATAPLAAVPSFQGVGAMLPTARLSEVAMFGVSVKATPIVFLEAVTAEERVQIWSYGVTHVVPPGELVVAAGTAERALYLLEEGELEVLVGEPGQQRQLTTMRTGSVFGEQAFLDGQPRSATVRAAERCVVRELAWQGYLDLAAAHPTLADRLLWDVGRVVSERLRRTTDALRALSA
jgi:CRP/FNR family cyclic AMP-dependent transcriptional regulator